MNAGEPIPKIQEELQEGMRLSKCRKCGCMKETLQNLQASLTSTSTENPQVLLEAIEHWLKQMQTIQYACLGCDHCFPAVAINIFHQGFPDAGQSEAPNCAFEVNVQDWPAVVGEYYAFCEGPSCPVAVSTLGSTGLAEQLARVRPGALCIVGKTETENIGIDKLIKNIVTNPTIRCLLLSGHDPSGHYSGKTLLSLWTNGVDEKMKVIGSPGRRPILKNVSREDVEAFRKQVALVDMIGCEDVEKIVAKIEALSEEAVSSCGCEQAQEITKAIQTSVSPIIQAKEPGMISLDKAGYFVILPQAEKQMIVVEYYTYDNTLQQILEGKDARSIYWTIIEKGWLTQLDHAAYLGKELAKAALSIQMGFKYVQDGA